MSEHDIILALCLFIVFLWLRGAWMIACLTAASLTLQGEQRKITFSLLLKLLVMWPLPWSALG